MRDYSALPENLRPQPFPALPGCSIFFSASALKNFQTACGAVSVGELLAGLLRGDIGMIEEAAARGVLNGDGSAWAGGVDAIPVDLLTLGRVLSDGVHRRWFGSALDMGGTE